ncbi:MAG: NADH-quinone oxidoreductase subunit NuoG [Proteobacteria bacterium]|nr:NADH-quinone oxidoreductase subunit NuoG [Pseudomonadota bacterium]MDA1011800.1 NADH-quinone oxidoreductase subunit NuoG [Pseudomonadota bacterium]
MITLEINGKTVEVDNGSTVMDAANKLGIYVPHFCYHKKLSIAANCRMCLVEVEKAPKPLPACATPAAQDMKVHTSSEQAKTAQKGVMEFLLINHPLDCPICDQGGECQLQDLAVGYGGSGSRFKESKRIVSTKELGPLVSAAEMSRCIHCTRCVRFGQEIAGVMELGMVGRGEHSEIMAFVGSTVDSELSGNMIDVCPVGALTSKPFRYAARTWELARRKTISPHDALGSNLTAQIKGDTVIRVVPHENTEINECWLSDRDRFAYEGLNATDRLLSPMIKVDSRWEEVDWATALDYIKTKLASPTIKPERIGALATPQATTEEFYLFQKLIRALGSENIDYRLRQADCELSAKAPWLGMSIADVEHLDRILVIGSNIRKEQPLLAHRIRQATKINQALLAFINPVNSDSLVPTAKDYLVAPSCVSGLLLQVVKAVCLALGRPVADALDAISVEADAKEIAQMLVSGQQKLILVGSVARHHPDRSKIEQISHLLGELVGAKVGLLSDGPNSLGAESTNVLPGPSGLNAIQMVDTPLDAYFLLHAEMGDDSCMPGAAIEAMKSAQLVVAMSVFKDEVAEYATVLLPISPFSETAGTFINMEGVAQSFGPVAPAKGLSRPGWRLLAALGKLFEFSNFEYESIEAVRSVLKDSFDGLPRRLQSQSNMSNELPTVSAELLLIERVSDVPMYSVDSIVRRAQALQLTKDALTNYAWLDSELAQELDVVNEDMVRVEQGGQIFDLPARIDPHLARAVIRIPMTSDASKVLGGIGGSVQVSKLQSVGAVA